MKKLLMAGLISGLFSAGAFAAACTATTAAAGAAQPQTVGDATAPTTGEMCICDGNVAGKGKINGGSGQVIGTPIFIKNGFDVQCSANTIISYSEVSATGFAVAGGSRKGNQTVQGSSAGGAVTTSAKCSSDAGCAFGDVTTALNLAITAAGGS